MAELISSTGSRQRPGMGPAKKHSLRVDMTPMVDLGFILITFFVMTVQLTKPATLNLIMPKQGADMLLGQSDALTLLMDNDKLYYYTGEWKTARENNEIFPTSFSVREGIGHVIRERQRWLDVNKKKEGRTGLMLLIKPGRNANYQSIVDALDETTINGVKKYVLLSPDANEVKWMTEQE
jgi:biopolymer transport protein ExbD